MRPTAVRASRASSDDDLISRTSSSMSPTKFARNTTSSSNCFLAFRISEFVVVVFVMTGVDDDDIDANDNDSDDDSSDVGEG